MIQAVIFDIGNVLIEWHPERFYDAAIGAEARAALFAAVDLHGMNDAVDRGGAFRDSVYALAGRHPEWEAPIRLWHDRWLEMAGPTIPHSLRLLRALRAKGTPVHALTNFGAETFALALEPFPFLAEFDQAFVSGRLGMAKPDAEIYALVEARTGLAPGALLFTDDRAENIAAAAARGWATHHFAGPEGLAARLVAEGLLTEAEAA